MSRFSVACRIVIAAVIALGFLDALACAAPQQGKSNDSTELVEMLLKRIGELESKIEELQASVAALQDRVDARPGIDATDNGDSKPEPVLDQTLRIMKVMSVEPVAVDGAKLIEAKSFRDKADKLEAEEKKVNDRIEKLMDVKPPDWRYWDDNRKERWNAQSKEQERQRADLRKQAVKLREEAKSLRGKATALEKDAKAVRQRIRGWDGTRSIILVTESDCSKALADATKTGFVSWKGGAVSNQEGDSHTLLVRRVDAAQRPPGFVDEASS